MLHIDSVPTAATVNEGDAILGVTPLTVTIDRSSVAGGPRRFVLTHEGFTKFVLEQGDSTTTVRASAALSAVEREGGEHPRRRASRRAGSGSASLGAEGQGGRLPVARATRPR